MANSGTVTTSPGLTGGGLTATFSWWITDIDNDKGTATLHWTWNVTGGTDAVKWSFIYGNSGSNYLKIGGNTKWYLDGYHYKDGAVASYGSTSYFSSNGVIESTGSARYVYIYAVLASGFQTITYNDEGYTSFSVAGSICCFNNQTVGNFSTTIYPDRIDRYNKSKKTTNSGSSWGNANFWKTVDGGRTWSKCNGYKTINYGSSWSKL